ncbi:MAG: response regulator transcription factor [Myxococcota bacterium]
MTAPAPVRVALVDDQEPFREGLATVLEAEGFLVVGEASDGHEAQWVVSSTRPDVVLMDLRMPNLDGVEAIRRLVTGGWAGPIIALTTFDEDELVFDALRAGAVGYLLKGLSGPELAAALRATASGSSIIAPEVGRKVLSEFVRLARLAPQQDTRGVGLSERELEILRELSRGASNKQIGHRLGVTEGTVKNHVSRVLEKLGAGSRTEAALWAREHGLA